MIKYSIIIPHKNIPQLLQRLLDSIPQRNDLEIIIVDDNSDSQKVNFQHFPGINRKDVKTIFDKTDLGAGYSRNLGLSIASGLYVLFADSDDYFNPCLNEILDDYSNNENDIVFFKASSVDCITYVVGTDRTDHINSNIDKALCGDSKAEKNLRYNYGEPWGKLIKRQLITDNNIKFDAIHSHNDTTFSYLIGYYATNVKFDNRALYCVTVREGSISVSLKTSAKKMIRIDVFCRKAIFFRKHQIPIHVDLHWYQLYDFYTHDFNSFNKAIKIIESYGYDANEIKDQLLRHHYRRTKNIMSTIIFYFRLCMLKI